MSTQSSKTEAKAKRKIGLFGGTFDPIHLGHIRMAERCKEQLELDEIWWIPASVPPHKTRRTTPYEKRRAWIEKTLDNNRRYKAIVYNRAISCILLLLLHLEGY